MLKTALSLLRSIYAARLRTPFPLLLLRPRLGATVFDIELSPRPFSVGFHRLHQLWRFHTLDA
jgi:hypothetical protein